MKDRLTKIKQKAEMMNLLLIRSVKYWTYIKNLLQFPLIFTTGALVIVNSYENTNAEWIKIVNIAVNSTNVCIMGILNQFKIAEKIANLSEKSTEFLELSHKIEAELYQNDLTNDRINTLQEKYDAILKNTFIEAIPDSIIEKVKKEYPDKHYPLGNLSCYSASSPSSPIVYNDV